MAAGGKESATVDNETRLLEDVRWKIQCLCRSKQPTTLVVGDLVTRLGLSEDVQQWFIQTCLRDEEWSEETLGQGDILYWKRMLHALMKAIERDGSAVVADVVGNALVDLTMEQRDEGVACSWLRKRYTYAGMNDTGKECCDDIEIWSNVNMFEGSTGCFEWDAGYFMAEYVVNHPEIFRNRVCVEIGCGCGMMTILLSRLRGIGPVLATDGNEETLHNCASNMKKNGVEMELFHADEQQACPCSPRPVIIKGFQWEQGWQSLVRDELVQEALNNYRAPLCVLGADVLYDPEIIPTIVPLIAEILEYMYRCRDVEEESRNPSYVYLSTRRRSDTTLEKFLDAVKAEPRLCIEDLSEQAHSNTDGIRFCHIPSLDKSRTAESILLHRLWYSTEC